MKCRDLALNLPKAVFNLVNIIGCSNLRIFVGLVEDPEKITSEHR